MSVTTQTDGPVLIVTIDRTNRVWLNESPLPLHLLEERLTTAAKGMAEPFVYLRADRAVPYGDVMIVMDRIKQSGIERVGLVTEPTPPNVEKTGFGRSRK